MNLALLDPFRRQIPDRIDSTLTVPRVLHPLWPQNQSAAEDDQQSKSSTDGKKSPVNYDGVEIDTLQTSKYTDGEQEGDVLKEEEKNDRDEEPKKAKKRKKDTNKNEEENRYWTACYTVSFNHRGTALASAYASGLVPVHDFMSRTMSAVYWPPPPISLGESETCASIGMENGLQFSGTFNEPGQIQNKKVKLSREQEGAATNKQSNYVNGVTSLSWDRHNRTVLAGSIGDYNLRLMDNSHPQVSLDCAEAVKREWKSKQSGNSSTKEEEKSEILQETTPSVYASFEIMDGEQIGLELQTSHWGRARLLRGNVVPLEKQAHSVTSSSAVLSSSPNPECSSTTKVYCMRHPTLVLELPLPLAGPAQLHPQHISTGLACLEDGSLVLFYIPTIAFFETPPAPAENMSGIDETEKLDNLKREDSRRVGNIGKSLLEWYVIIYLLRCTVCQPTFFRRLSIRPSTKQGRWLNILYYVRYICKEWRGSIGSDKMWFTPDVQDAHFLDQETSRQKKHYYQPRSSEFQKETIGQYQSARRGCSVANYCEQEWKVCAVELCRLCTEIV